MFGMLAGLGSALSGAVGTVGSWLGGAAGALTSAVKALAGNKVVQKAAGAALSAIAKPSKPTAKPKPKITVRSEGKTGDPGGKDNTMLYIAIAGVAAVALIMLMKK